MGSHTHSLSIEISWEVKCEVGQPQTHPPLSLADKREELGKEWVELGRDVPGCRAPVEIGAGGREGCGIKAGVGRRLY